MKPLSAQSITRALLADLVANAKRRRLEGRYDDAVARLYRAIEAAAQLALSERQAIPSTDGVPIASVPEPLRELWSAKAENGKLRLGLQDAYELLDALGDRVGAAFKELRLHEMNRSPLAARNQSILAHGFQPVSSATVDKLYEAAMQLSGLAGEELPTFPRLTGGQAPRVEDIAS
jgi:CRISPR-associated protein (TIGR02710 family)